MQILNIEVTKGIKKNTPYKLIIWVNEVQILHKTCEGMIGVLVLIQKFLDRDRNISEMKEKEKENAKKNSLV